MTKLFTITALFLIALTACKSEKKKDDSFDDAMKQLEESLAELQEVQQEEEAARQTDDFEIFTLSFAHNVDRAFDTTCKVKIDGDKVIVVANDDLDGVEQEVIASGILVKHKSGRTIIGQSEEDANLDEVGGCSGGPMVIDLENGIVWTC